MLASFDDLFSETRPSFKVPICKKSYFSVNFRKSVFALSKRERLGMRVFRGGTCERKR